MRNIIYTITISLLLVSCIGKTKQESIPLKGTWKLITGTIIKGNDTTITNYTENLSFIKIINDTHFAFLSHDLIKGSDSTKASYSSGGGRYSLDGDKYTEHLEYCNYRMWEGNDFTFTVTIKNDTLIQTGIEKIENSGVNQLNTEKYVRLTN